MVTADKAAKKYLRNSLRAFFEGTQNERWILGVIGATSAEHLAEALDSLSSYAGHARFQFV